MPDQCSITARTAEEMEQSGASLARTLYTVPLTVLLSGPLGAGKTTFLQGFGQALGIAEHITSPTFALEQRYLTQAHGELLHIDLYRLPETAARTLAEQSEDHAGIRCIEWSERLENTNPQDDLIIIHIDERTNGTRQVTCTFRDIALPTQQQVQTWRAHVCLPENVAQHCDAVAAFARQIGEHMLSKGYIVRPLALERAAQLHDLFRFVDFLPTTSDNAPQPTREHWADLKKTYGSIHEDAAAQFVTEQGFPAIGHIFRTHGMKGEDPTTIEQQLLFYADKRVMGDTIVTLEERFADFRQRYSGGRDTQQSSAWLAACKRMEQQLFPESAP
ncbi:tRNA (adenosine(37)-N6)-threonylcarbamoyltransferase complex ATPase subunit type 1 TsaE [Candidatus Peribacteria bacterium]|nr:tRNA (adenosine(37)-N6)-threonylcarbamoyltransferase complex ATPase subunit type 1 TsaE [Candidatus Peribacteria bacterium]